MKIIHSKLEKSILGKIITYLLNHQFELLVHWSPDPVPVSSHTCKVSTKISEPHFLVDCKELVLKAQHEEMLERAFSAVVSVHFFTVKDNDLMMFINCDGHIQ